ncbi:MAG: glycosyltransferase family 2 protein [Methanosarcinaceae archaeon]|nr:glycosyltransferase family 2 protein [Methanosarcinaceae archaeon]
MTTISVVMPSMNEEGTIATCIKKAQNMFRALGVDGEIIVVDNSTDGTPQIARSLGATVLSGVEGYGNAYLIGLAHASGDYIAIADADNTYDLEELPKFMNPLMNNEADFIIGTRLKGTIRKGAMPALHQYIGNPLLTWMLNILFKVNISDAHCGMRAFTHEALDRMDLKTKGMELASEMVIEAADKGLRIKEVPITYHVREAPSKLRSFEDGWRHVRFMMMYRPTPFLFVPGLIVFLMGVLLTGTLVIEGDIVETGLHSFVLGAILTIIGSQILATAIYVRAYGYVHGINREEGLIKKLLDYHSLEKELLAGGLLVLLGLLLGLQVVTIWVSSGYGSLSEISTAVAALVSAAVGLQMIFTSILLSILMLDMDGERV